MKRDPDAENCRSCPSTLRRLTQAALIDVFSEEDKERFRDPEYYKQFRHELESDLNVGSLLLIAKGVRAHRFLECAPVHDEGQSSTARGPGGVPHTHDQEACEEALDRRLP